MDDGAQPRLSVVIPAHDEARVLGRCLDALAPLVADGSAEVVVVANGCSDGTAEVARNAGVKVVELVQPGKAGALNAGDAAVTAYPRVYLDADIEVAATTLLALAAALPDERPLAGAPTVRFDLADRPWPVRAWYRAYCALPYVAQGPIGLGLYAVSRAGRARFGAFPDLFGDDLFVERSFAPSERVVLAAHTFTVQSPRTLAALVAVRTRVAAGNAEMAAAHAGDEAFAPTTGDSGRALLTVALQRPRLAFDIAVYAAVAVTARLRARRSGRRGGSRWERDDTTR